DAGRPRETDDPREPGPRRGRELLQVDLRRRRGRGYPLPPHARRRGRRRRPRLRSRRKLAPGRRRGRGLGTGSRPRASHARRPPRGRELVGRRRQASLPNGRLERGAARYRRAPPGRGIL
ncbi:MAG: hypothetical protein AVDCRST_MAG25-2987, partial [uncultured Rubrobacteraceae bacterium]